MFDYLSPYNNIICLAFKRNLKQDIMLIRAILNNHNFIY